MIYVTGAHGYLGSEIMNMLGRYGRAIRTPYPSMSGYAVIHCAAVVPKTMDEANTLDYAPTLALMRQVLDARPVYVVLVSTNRGGGAYLASKRETEHMLRESGLRGHILRFPGLYGPPKNHGVAWEWIHEGKEPPAGWSGLWVRTAARHCIYAACEPRVANVQTTSYPGITDHTEIAKVWPSSL